MPNRAQSVLVVLLLVIGVVGFHYYLTYREKRFLITTEGLIAIRHALAMYTLANDGAFPDSWNSMVNEGVITLESETPLRYRYTGPQVRLNVAILHPDRYDILWSIDASMLNNAGHVVFEDGRRRYPIELVAHYRDIVNPRFVERLNEGLAEQVKIGFEVCPE